VENGRYREITINGRVTPCHKEEGGADTPPGEKRRRDKWNKGNIMLVFLVTHVAGYATTRQK